MFSQWWSRLKPGGSDPRDRIIKLLEDQNALLRAQLQLKTFRPVTQPIRRATESDVLVLTRDAVLVEDLKTRQEPVWTPEEVSSSPPTLKANAPTSPSPEN